jgi:hypothetical protein
VISIGEMRHFKTRPQVCLGALDFAIMVLVVGGRIGYAIGKMGAGAITLTVTAVDGMSAKYIAAQSVRIGSTVTSGMVFATFPSKHQRWHAALSPGF